MLNSFFKENIVEILDNIIDEGVHMADSSGVIIYYNKFAAALDNINPEEAIGRHILEIYPSLSEETSTILKVIRSGKPILNYQQSFKNYKGLAITTVNSTIPIKSGKKVIGAIEISKDITEVKKLSEKVVDLQAELYSENRQHKKIDQSHAIYTFADIIGTSEEMLKLKKNALAVADSPSPVLVYGETGTGKELLIHAIHNASSRRNKPFIAQNCAALPESLLESILFGTVRGSFTGAETRPGLFEIADSGTLFLDEINSMPLQLQAKLLRVIQDGNIRRIGDTKTIHVDVRIMTAINTEPAKALKEKTLRDDLFYRLSVITLRMPDLQDRRQDIPALVEYFIRKYNGLLNKTIKAVQKDVMDFFMSYTWPGNIRELEHTIEGAMNIADGRFLSRGNLPYHLLEDFDNTAKHKDEDIKPLKEAIWQLESQLLETALKKNHGNVTKAAEMLDVPRQTLQYKMSKYKLTEYSAEN